MQLAKKAGGVALKLSQSHSQIAVTLSKSELKKLIPTAPGGAQSERAHTCSVLRGRARRYLDSRCRPAVAKADGRFYKSTTGGKKAPVNTTDSVGDRRGTGNAQD